MCPGISFLFLFRFFFLLFTGEEDLKSPFYLVIMYVFKFLRPD